MTILPVASSILRGVIFDLGGTLIRYADAEVLESANAGALARWALARGFAVPADIVKIVRQARTRLWEETLATGRQITTREIIAHHAPGFGWPVDDQLLDEAVRAFYHPEIAGAQAYPDAVATLSTLRRMRLRLGAISNAADHGLVEVLLAEVGLREFFDPVVSSAGFGRIKPDPGIFRLVLDAWGLSAHACVMVGDSSRADIFGAKQVGMRAIRVTMEANPWNDRLPSDTPPDATAASLSDVVAIIQGWLARGATR